MATPTGFPECSKVLVPFPGTEETTSNLPILSVPGLFTASVWELTLEERMDIAKSGKLVVFIVAGGVTQPAMYATAYAPGIIAEVTADMTGQPRPPRP